MKYSDEQRIAKICGAAEKLLNFVAKDQITPGRIFGEEPIRWAITTPLYNIDEHAANLSDEFRKKHAEIPWVKIAGLRYWLLHHFEDTNRTLIC